MLSRTGGTGAPLRQAWDLKGKVSDMEGKIRNYQTKVKSVNEENEALKGSVVQSQSKMAELEKEIKSQRSKIRFDGDFILYDTIFPFNSFNNVYFSYSEYEAELVALSGVRKELEKVTDERNLLQMKLSNLEESYKVMESLRNSQETELQALKVKSLLF